MLSQSNRLETELFLSCSPLFCEDKPRGSQAGEMLGVCCCRFKTNLLTQPAFLFS